MSYQRNDNYAIIPDANGQRMLLLQEEAGWSLPRYAATLPDEINATMLASLGFTTFVLFCIYDRYQDGEYEEQHRVYVLDNLSPRVALPSNGRWIDQSELASLSLAIQEHRAVLESWFTEGNDSQSVVLRPPWMRPGWFSGVEAWIDRQLDLQGEKRIAPIRQVAAQRWSSVLQIQSTAGVLYFKMPASIFEFEPALTQLLARLVPDFVPRLLGVDLDRYWLLMRDEGPTLRTAWREPVHMEEVFRLYARMQIDLIPHVEEIEKTGIPDWRLPQMPHLYENLLARTDLLLLDEPGGLTPAEYERLLALAPRLKEICAELASYRVPETLQHNDLHSNNLTYNGERYTLIDLAECILAHPFGSLFSSLRSARNRLGYDDQTIERLRLVYLAEWTDYEPIERLERAFALAQCLGALYRALLWQMVQAEIAPEERRMNYADMLPSYLRDFLEMA